MGSAIFAAIAALGMLVGSAVAAVWAMGVESGLAAWGLGWLFVLALAGGEGNQP
jgi:hypothetical protein